MRRGGGGKMEVLFALSRRRSFQFLLAAGALYLFLITFELPFFFSVTGGGGGGGLVGGDASDKLVAESLPRGMLLEMKDGDELKDAPVRPGEVLSRAPERSVGVGMGMGPSRSPAGVLGFPIVSSLNLSGGAGAGAGDGMEMAVKEAADVGTRYWADLESGAAAREVELKRSAYKSSDESCPNSISLSGAQFAEKKGVMVLPCGLTLGSHITLVGKPHRAHVEYDPKISNLKEGSMSTLVSQFRMELQGLKTVDGEDPPRILHFNPRLMGDWSAKPVIELNTCYRMQWGSPQRCEGWISKTDEETVDGQIKCEKWIRDGDDHSESTKASWWLNRLIGRTKKVSVNWPYPFVEEKLFVLTLSAGLEGYHISVDGRHITSFPYRTGFTLEDATGLSLIGDLQIQSIYAASLPSNHPSFAPQRYLQMSHAWKAPPFSSGHVELFIGILSAGNHFAERMAVRKSWMQSKHIKSSNVVVRFFVALHGRKEVNVELKKEAEFFGDIIIVPFMDSYDLVVLKTVAICEYGARIVSAKYTMKCDDDTFVRVDSVLAEARKIPSGKSFYIGNINYYHKPLRFGKWAVTYEEWPEEDYPPYANGPGYIVSSNIAHFVASEFEKQTIRLFKMEDVSMGMWVEKFNSTSRVQYVHDGRFVQSGCVDDYFTAHYQSPRQMLCLWDKLRSGKAHCCNFR